MMSEQQRKMLAYVVHCVCFVVRVQCTAVYVQYATVYICTYIQQRTYIYTVYSNVRTSVHMYGIQHGTYICAVCNNVHMHVHYIVYITYVPKYICTVYNYTTIIHVLCSVQSVQR